MRDDKGRPRRRDVFALLVAAAALMAGAAGAQTVVQACDTEDADPGRASMRLALEYASPSKFPGKACGGCAFFTASGPTCGSCQLLNGPVVPGAACSSWAPKK